MSKDKNDMGLKFSKEKNPNEWYLELLQKAELADYAPVKGFMVIRPNAYSIWQSIQDEFNRTLKEKGVRNAYFPLLIPESFFKKEAEHAQGFAPELAYIAGSEEGERYAIRPTSETIMYDSYSKWIRSWRDLPLKINQWCNVVRWEVKQTKPFLRTREFLWQEGHCVFETEEQAVENQMEMIDAYKKLVEDVLAIPVLLGRKSKSETFAGAVQTQAIEGLMPDGKALQCGTSHNLGQGFAKSFNVMFKGRDEKQHPAWQTSWGFSTRLIGALVMMHGDDKGLVLPPKVAYHKAVIVPIFKEEDKENVMKKAKELAKKLEEFTPFIDEREGYSPGWKFNEWEMKGLPLRIEIGPKDIKEKQVVIVRRDNGKKEIVKEKDIEKKVEELLEDIQKSLFSKAKKDLDSKIDSASSLDELQKKLDKGNFVKVYFADTKQAEEKLKDQTGANSRIVENTSKEGKCVITGEKVKTIAYVARAY